MRQLIDFKALIPFILVAILGSNAPVIANESDTSRSIGQRSGEPLPRFVSLKDRKVYMRRGPGTEHPIIWVYVRADMPIEILEEYEDWRRVRDIDDAVGWIKKTKLTSRRHTLVRPPAGANPDTAWPLRAKPSAASPAVAQAEPGVIAELRRCPNAWCEVKAGRVTGWVERGALWGVYPTEIIN